MLQKRDGSIRSVLLVCDNSNCHIQEVPIAVIACHSANCISSVKPIEFRMSPCSNFLGAGFNTVLGHFELELARVADRSMSSDITCAIIQRCRQQRSRQAFTPKQCSRSVTQASDGGRAERCDRKDCAARATRGDSSEVPILGVLLQVENSPLQHVHTSCRHTKWRVVFGCEAMTAELAIGI